MDNATYDPKMLPVVVAGDALADDPFVLIDVGCGLGIDPAWRFFRDKLRGHGFDPQVAEVERLEAAEKGGMQYHAAFIGLPDDHPLVVRRNARRAEDSYFDVFGRTSASAAQQRAAAIGDSSFYETNDWVSADLAHEKLGLAEALRREGVEQVDFVKIDTDGSDRDVVLSFEEMIETSGVLGFMIETPLTGSDDVSANTFHTIDPLLKRHGFLVGTIEVNRYSRAALPAQFKYAILAQTNSGQPIWTDAVYFRDVVHPDWRRFGELSPTKLLKLACLYELFELPDCAAELLLAHRDDLADLVDVDAMLDLLTPPLDGVQLSYRDYVAAFHADPTRFYPSPEPVGEIEPEPAPPKPTLVQQAKHLAARLLGRV